MTEVPGNGPRRDTGVARETVAAQALGRVDPATHGLVPPIHLSTTFERNADGSYRDGRVYSRADSPAYDEPEQLLTHLEGGDGAMLFSSGMAAATSVFCALVPGDHVVAPAVQYWALRKWMAEFAMSFGIEVSFVDATAVNAIAAAIRPGRTRVVWLETPANPTWEVSDIAATAGVAHAAGAKLIVDSTVATPVFTRPIEFGADLVMHSATKYLNGHSDVVAGALVYARDDPFVQRIRAWRRSAGNVLGPMESWLLLRGMRTLYVRVRQQATSAQIIAERLIEHPRVASVLYPGLPNHPGHALASRQMRGGFGGMLSIRMRGGERAAMEVAGRLQVIKRATSLGGTESLVEHRASVEGPSSSVPDDLLRFSLGLEDVEDLWSDLVRALDSVSTQAESSTRRGVSTSRSIAIARGADLDETTGAVLGSPGAVNPENSAMTVIDPTTSMTNRVVQVITEMINPSVAAHEGRVELVSIDAQGVARIRLEGRCQGCTLAEVTVRQGVLPILRREVPEVVGVIDDTDHALGDNPFFRPAKR